MKVVQTTSTGETRELLLKEFFLNAYLIAMLKQFGTEAGKLTRRPAEPELAPIPVRDR